MLIGAVEFNDKAAIAQARTSDPMSGQFTPANAREMQVLSTIVRQGNGAKFTKRLMSRVRVRINAILVMLDSELDPNKIDRLCAGLGKLCEIERQLAGRPLPGSLKPRAAKETRESPDVQPLDDDPV